MPTDGSTAAVKALCLKCGLCCNGVLFADVRLARGEAAGRLGEFGLSVRRRGAVRSFCQPCQALQPDGRCGAYDHRPAMCRQFECGVLKECATGRIGGAAALGIIQRAKRLASKVLRLLEDSGNRERHLPLTIRFQSVMREPIDLSGGDEAGDVRGELMMAVQQLMNLLQARFLTADRSADNG